MPAAAQPVPADFSHNRQLLYLHRLLQQMLVAMAEAMEVSILQFPEEQALILTIGEVELLLKTGLH
jgi:hypothetical protein